MSVSTALQDEIERVVRREHPDPHHVLGAHAEDGGVVVRVYRPAAERVLARPEGAAAVELRRLHPAGVWEGRLDGAELPLAYELEVGYADGSTYLLRDPYAFEPTLGPMDLHLLGEGRHEALWEVLGAHRRELRGVCGTSFAVWAPAARAVSVVGDFNSWDGRLHAMRSLGASGVWELFIPGVEPGARYKFEILTQARELRLKADPVAFAAELPPQTASVVWEPGHEWRDAAWIERRRATEPHRGPMTIYEVHLGSWRP